MFNKSIFKQLLPCAFARPSLDHCDIACLAKACLPAEALAEVGRRGENSMKIVNYGMMSANTAFDIIAIGDTTQDIFLQMTDASLQCDMDGKNCRLCFDYADKIPVDKKTDVPAVGNAANHAIGAARLGLQTSIYTVVGDDTPGHIARDVFTENQVDTSYLAFDKEHGTNFSAVINYKSERTIFVYHEPRRYQLPAMTDTRWLYLTSASHDGLHALHQQVLQYLDEHPATKLSFNPGTHQMNAGLEALTPLLARCEVLFLNREEAARVLGRDTRDIQELIVGFHKVGVKNMVLTDGPNGAYASDGHTMYVLKIFEGPVVERTGCGDAFGSGFMAAHINGESVPTAMLWGNANSTSVLQYVGAREGLLDTAGVKQLIAENSDIIPIEFATL